MDKFHNLPAEMLADEIGAIDSKIKVMEEELKAAKEAFKRLAIEKAAGALYTVSAITAVRQTLDTTAVKAEMGQKWFDDHSKLAEVQTVRIAVNRAALAEAA